MTGDMQAATSTVSHRAAMPGTEKLESALMLAGKGLFILPLEPGRKTPRPGESWLHLKTRDEQVIRGWFDDNPSINYGVNPGENWVIIDLDYDPRSGKNGEQQLRQLESNEKFDDWVIDDTFCVSTPRGGKHLYLHTDQAVSNSTGTLPPGIDVRGSGGYVVGPGCHLDSTDDGKIVAGEYAIFNDADIFPAPRWLMNHLTVAAKCSPPVRGLLCEFDHQESVERAREFLVTRPPAVEGRRGDCHTYDTAVILRDFGLSSVKAFELLCQKFIPSPNGPASWNDLCDPPWPEDQLRVKVQNAYRYAKEPAGSRSGSLLRRFDSESYATDPDEDRPLSATELATGDYPPPEYAVDRLLIAGPVNLLVGDGGTGKTTLALQAGVAVASGRPLFGLSVKQMPVLFVLAEDDNGETKKRLLNICTEVGVRLEGQPIKIWARPGADSTLANISDLGTWDKDAFFDPLCREIESIGPCLLVLDSLADIATLDENKRLPVNTLCKKVLGQLCRRFGCTILVLGHPSKAAMNDGSGYAGSTAWNNAVRNRLTLEIPKDRPESSFRTLKVGKANYSARHNIELSLYNGVFSSIQQADGRRRLAELRDKIFEFMGAQIMAGNNIIRGNGSGVKVEHILTSFAERYGVRLSKKEMLQHLADLELEGRLEYAASNKNDRHARAGFRLGSQTMTMQ